MGPLPIPTLDYELQNKKNIRKRKSAERPIIYLNSPKFIDIWHLLID